MSDTTTGTTNPLSMEDAKTVASAIGNLGSNGHGPICIGDDTNRIENDTTTGGKASFEELVRLREAARLPIEPGWQYMEKRDESGFLKMRVHQPTADFTAYAANHCITIIEKERAHSDRLAEALKFVLNAPHPPRLPSGACICVQHEDAGKLVDEHAKLREGK